jgi:NAD(P)-dependent dehydrogenase (short-subunit alcohol dehydrogenase family)
MTKGLTKEFAPLNIRVNAVSPGTVDTNYHRSFSTPEGSRWSAGCYACWPAGYT